MDATIVLGRYLVLAGATRFVIEFVRINEHVLFGLTVAHIASLTMIGLGFDFFSVRARVSRRPSR